jgi:hypothetical protein
VCGTRDHLLMPWSGSQILPTSLYEPGRDTSVIVNRSPFRAASRSFELHHALEGPIVSTTSPLNSFAASAHLLWRMPESPQPTCVAQGFCSANCPLGSTLPRRRNCQMERQ